MTSGFLILASAIFSPSVLPVTVGQSRFSRFGTLLISLRIALMPPAASTSSTWILLDGETLQILGQRAEISLIRSRSYLMPASLAMASVCRTVLVEPPIAISSTRALSIDLRLMMSSGLMSFSTSFMICLAAALYRSCRFGSDGQDRAVAGQGHADCLAQAVHRVGGEHAGAASAGGAARRIQAR